MAPTSEASRDGGHSRGATDLEEELGAFLHDLLDLQEAGGVHEEELVPHRHAEAARVTESQNLLEALRLHGRRQLHHGWARVVAARASAIAAEKVPEVRAAGSEHSSVGLRGEGGGNTHGFSLIDEKTRREKCRGFCFFLQLNQSQLIQHSLHIMIKT